MSDKSLPVIIDEVIESLDMARCNYFHIGVDFQLVETTEDLNSIFSKPSLIFPYFLDFKMKSPKDIDDLLQIVEENPFLTYNINEIWLPRLTFKDVPIRGSVYRVSKNLFLLCDNFLRGTFSREKFFELAEYFRDNLHEIREETNAFAEWQKIWKNTVNKTLNTKPNKLTLD
jgi:hypothetical protein